jgi:hypothetical protein
VPVTAAGGEHAAGLRPEHDGRHHDSVSGTVASMLNVDPA